LRLDTANYERLRRLSGDIVAQKELDKAFAAVSDARIKLATTQQGLINLGLPVDVRSFDAVPNEQLPERLRFLGLSKNLSETLDLNSTTGNLLPVVAPFDGVVATRDVVAGEFVDAAKVLIFVVDARRLWLMLDVTQQDARSVRLGQKVRFRPASGKEETAGTISWISTEVNDRTRTIKVRAEFENADGSLRANTFGTGRIILREDEKAIVILNSALQWDGDCHIVFVRDKNFLQPGSPKVFHTRKVRPGAKDDKWTEIIAGVLPGEVVATKGSSVLRAELLRANLGDG
jgi:cobalt-zinc-cadmium efflux system membrane fusion protein